MKFGEGPVPPLGDRERWDRKHAQRSSDGPGAPDPFVIEVLDGWERGRWGPPRPPGRVLDLACGVGRHALEAARRGWRVSAWDVSPVALGMLHAQASDARIATREVDLCAALPRDAGRAFDLVLCINYLDRELWERAANLLAECGWLALSTFTDDHPGTRPSADHRLRPRELEAGLPDWSSLHYSESGGRAGWLGTPGMLRDPRPAPGTSGPT